MTAQKAGRGIRSKTAASLSSGSSVSASHKAAPYVLTAAALGLVLAILAAAGYLAEHAPTLLALAIAWLAIGVVFVRLFDGRPL
jgi:hypothetical protein